MIKVFRLLSCDPCGRVRQPVSPPSPARLPRRLLAGVSLPFQWCVAAYPSESAVEKKCSAALLHDYAARIVQTECSTSVLGTESDAEVPPILAFCGKNSAKCWIFQILSRQRGHKRRTMCEGRPYLPVISNNFTPSGARIMQVRFFCCQVNFWRDAWKAVARHTGCCQAIIPSLGKFCKMMRRLVKMQCTNARILSPNVAPV